MILDVWRCFEFSSGAVNDVKDVASLHLLSNIKLKRGGLDFNDNLTKLTLDDIKRSEKSICDCIPGFYGTNCEKTCEVYLIQILSDGI